MYDATSVVNRLKDRTDFLQGKASAVFASPTPEGESAAAKSFSQPVPGPGQYKNAGKHSNAPNVNAAVAAFKSISKRGEAGPEQGDHPSTIPGPGAYYSQKAILPSAGSGHDGSNAVFKEPCQRRFCAVHPDLPVASESALQNLGDFSAVVAKECVGQRPTDLPGPGAFDQDRDAMWGGRDYGVSGMSSFQPGPKRTNWANEEIGAMPGPGHYKPKIDANLHVTDAKSSFISATEQHGFADLQKGPGPCYYKPPALVLNPGKSFLLNSKKRFL
jgi:hypothetical protein